MRPILACCTILLTGCTAYRISTIDDGALHAVRVSASSRVEVTKTNKGLEGFQCYEPLLYGLTLGVIPVNCVDTYAVSVTSTTGETAQGTYKVSVWVGWASVLLAPLPNWHWQMGYGHGVDPAGEIEGRVRGASR